MPAHMCTLHRHKDLHVSNEVIARYDTTAFSLEKSVRLTPQAFPPSTKIFSTFARTNTRPPALSMTGTKQALILCGPPLGYAPPFCDNPPDKANMIHQSHLEILGLALQSNIDCRSTLTEDSSTEHPCCFLRWASTVEPQAAQQTRKLFVFRDLPQSLHVKATPILHICRTCQFDATQDTVNSSGRILIVEELKMDTSEGLAKQAQCRGLLRR